MKRERDQRLQETVWPPVRRTWQSALVAAFVTGCVMSGAARAATADTSGMGADATGSSDSGASDTSSSTATPASTPAATGAQLPVITVTGQADPVAQAINPPTTVGSKIPVSQREIPQSVSVVTQQQIQAQNASSVDDAMKYVPGVTVNLVNPNDTAYYARGFPISTFQLDGVPTTLPQSGSGMVADNLAMYDRVEVLRGPAGLYNGFGGDGGTINLVRKRAPSTFQASAQVSVGTYADHEEQVDIGGPLNAAGTLRGRIVADQHDQHLMQDGSWQRDQQVYGTLEADLTSTTTARVGFSYTKEFGHVMYGIPAYSDYTLVPVPRSAYIGAPWDYLNSEKTNAFAEVEQKLAGGWTAKVAYNHSQINTHFLNGIPGGPVDPETNDGNPYSYNYQDANTQDAVDLYATGPFKLLGRTHHLTIGANYLHQSDQSTQYFINPDSGLDIWGDYATNIFTSQSLYSNDFEGGPQNSYKTVTNQYGIYGNARFSILDPLTLIVGGRVTWWNNTLTPNANPYYNEFGETYAHTSEGPKFTPFVGLVYDINDTYSAYASYTSIYKPQTSFFTYTGNMIKPVTGNQYEIGLKGEYFGGKLNTSIALFQINEDNRAFSDPEHQGFYLAQGSARSRGVETEASGEVLPGWTVSGGYTYTMVSSLDESKTQGSPFSMTTPKHLFKLWTNYQLPGKFHDWNVGGALYVQSSTYYSDGVGSVVAPGYATVDATIGYQITKNVSAALSVTNLFDRKYLATVAGAGGNYYGNPAKVLFTLRAKI